MYIRMTILALAALVATTPARADEATEKVLNCIRANVPETLRVQEISLTTSNNSGDTQVLKGRLFAMREKAGEKRGLLRAMLRVDGPASVAGVSYLVRETDDYLRDGMFIYLPSVKRVRRVTGTFADGSLLNTRLSYYDFKQMANAFGDLAAQLEAPSEIEGRPVYTLVFTALEGSETRYTSVKAWVDQKTCVPLKAEFYEGPQPRKQLTAPVASLQQSDKYWYASELEMLDLTDNGKTVLKIGKINTTNAPPDSYFNQNSFYLGN